ncbi:MAG: tRNA (adenosine(37)-N6)-threonylcarbamoyltransferase complex dimerization subunit type 1 TsaB [Alphaproteobacteria bacterium]|nr:tRNA (adenosine(37)-N6)-threonylcarbamoyltransferase complex dimerization subunit type 1 TsaB [Alphaproteobacteria bacterium]
MSIGQPTFPLPMTPPPAPHILLLECSGATAQCAVISAHNPIDNFSPPPTHPTLSLGPGKSEKILPLIEQAMTGFSYADLAAIAVTIGPGSFTGIRVGMSLAMGIAAAWDLPLFGINLFEVGKRQIRSSRIAPPDQNFVVLVDSRRHSLYRQIYPADRVILAECDETSYDDWSIGLSQGDWWVIGNGTHFITHEAANQAGICARLVTPDVSPWQALAMCAREKWFDYEQTGNVPNFAPLYIRPADVTLAKPILAQPILAQPNQK